MSTPLERVILCACGVVIKTEEEKPAHADCLNVPAPTPSFSKTASNDGERKKQKAICPNCKQTIKERYKITLTRHMVTSMRNVYMWCGENKRHEFRRYEINHLLAKDETGKQGAHFGDLVYFGGIFYKEKKGVWGMNMKRAKAFLHGQVQINSEAWKTPGEKGAEEFAPVFISQVKDIKELLDENYFFVPEYENTQTL